MILGMVTMLMAGGSALIELDIKKVIALSTLRQLGVIFFRMGLRQPFVSLFHLISHAYFKAILFMAAGAMIHSVKDYQDLRKMGGFMSNHILIGSVILIRNLRLCGLPFMSGFYSKDIILEMFILKEVTLVWFGVSILATLLTIAYSCRFALGLFIAIRQREAFRAERDTDLPILAGMGVLVAPSIIGG